TLYTYPENWRAFKALIAAQYSGARLRVLSGPPHFHFGHTNRTPQFLQKFPVGKVGPEPRNLGAWGGGGFGFQSWTPKIGQFQVGGLEVFKGLGVVLGSPPQCWSPLPNFWCPHQATEVAKEEVKRVLGVLDGHLKTRTFLVGERVSLADISLVCALLWLYKQVLDPAFRGPFGNVNRWFLTCLNQPQFKAVLGEVQLCQRMAQFDAKKFAESQARKDKETPKKEKEPPKKEKPPKKEEKRPEPDEDLDECEQVLAAEPKAKDPFAHLPKSPFVLDEFKRKYSNEDTLGVALPHFWEHFDREGWSLWYCQYRYPEELSQTFMSCNLITGMFQRLDKLRKNAFASVVLFGSDHDSSISGVWVMRGQELAFTLCPDWQVDYESYTWRKLDPDSAECRTLVTEYFLWEGEFRHVGKPFNQGKIFK
ncbi:EF1G factor, partial [Rhipidura dahli]|nr:EF1G factor [Rhipidura dahli]